MLKTILDFKGIEKLSVSEQKNTKGGDQTVCTIPYTALPYNGPCVMLPPDLPTGEV
jgi:hypothetical protein